MDIKGPKIAGWFLLLFGLGMILWTFYSSYNIFTAKVPAPEIFEIGKIEEETKTPLPAPETVQAPGTSQTQMEKILQEQMKEMLPIKEMLPADVVPRLLNLVCWSIFAGIMFFGGSQIATLGIKLIK